MLRDGCIYTGDIGKLDAEGFLYITDRKKDIVIRGGENIGCAEVEAAIYEHPAVAEVAVYGLADERLGEVLAATVLRKPGSTLQAAELVRRLQARLATFKIPERIHFTSQPLPKVATGKVDKLRLRRAAT